MNTPVALVTGANRGIGLETARQLAQIGRHVLIGARDPDAGRDAADRLRGDGAHVEAVALDVASEDSVTAAAERIARDGKVVEVLVNNAGIYPVGDLLTVSPADVRAAMDINAFGALWCARSFLPGMVQRGYGRIVNLGSGYGCFAGGLQGPGAYSLSKAALHAITVMLAAAAAGDLLVNAVDPGWVRTRMGGADAARSVEDAAADVVWAATLPENGPQGCLLRRRQPVAW